MRFTTALKKICALDHKIKILQGSQGASKTISTLQRWVLMAQESKHTELCTTITDSLPNLKSGAAKDLEDILDADNISYTKTKSPLEFKINNWTFEFFGVQEEKKGLGGRRDRLFINEANRVHWKVARQMIGRTHKEVIIDFNPIERFWAHKYYSDIKGSCDFLILTFKDNEQLPESERLSIERHAPDGELPDEEFYTVFGKGQIGVPTNKIWRGWKYIADEDYHKINTVDLFYGYDDGFVAPRTLIELKWHNETLYIHERFYKANVNVDECIDEADARGQNKFDPIICDSAGAEAIAAWYNRGYNAIKSKKGVKDGLDYVRRFSKIYVTESSVNVWREYHGYKYQEDKDGMVLPVPVKKDDHAMNSIQYAAVTHLNWVFVK